MYDVSLLVSKLSARAVAIGFKPIAPYPGSVGAATLHPLLLAGRIPERSRVFWVQRCLRPDDAGRSQIRNAVHHQFQLLAPAGDPSEIVFRLLEGLVEPEQLVWIPDNWQNPTIAAYGSGWEIRFGRTEICQVTLFNRIAGRSSPAGRLEIVFGLERLAQILAGAPIRDYTDGYRDRFTRRTVDLYNRVCSLDSDGLSAFSRFTERLLALRTDPGFRNLLAAIHAYNLMNAANWLPVSEDRKYSLYLAKWSVLLGKR